MPDIDAKDISKQLNSIVPEFYYDLISRVVPGLAILTILASLAKGWEYLLHMLAGLSIGSATIFAAALCTMGYLAAVLCLPIGEVIRYLLTPLLWRAVVRSSYEVVCRVGKEFGFTDLQETWRPSMINMAYRMIHENLRTSSERTVVLSKLQAETAQCGVLVGFFALLLVAISLKSFLPEVASTLLRQPGVMLLGIVGFCLSLLALIFRNFRLWNRHLSKLYENLRNQSDVKVAEVKAGSH